MFKEFKKGLIKDNPVFVLMLGLCPALAMSTYLNNAIGMGVAVTFVLLCSNFIISLLRKFITPSIRIPAFIVVIASFVTIVQLVVASYLPALDKSLGVYLPLITVNCIVLGRAEAFASKNTPLKSVFDGVGMGIGFMLSIMLIAVIREVLGQGTLTIWGDFGFSIPFLSSHPIRVIGSSPGALLVMGIILAVIAKRKESK